MRRACLVVALAALLTGTAAAAPPMETNQLVGGDGTPIGTTENPFQVGAMAFQRSGGAMAFPVSTTPQTYAVVQPAGSTSYRGINPCNVDVVISSVTVSMPVTTQPATMGGQTIPNVQLVTSSTAAVNQFTGTLFMARSGRTLGSSPNPMAGTVRYVSIAALADPGATPCAFRLHYGTGN